MPSNPAPKNDFIPLCIPHLNGNEAKYLQECIESTFVSSVGPFVNRFEEEFAQAINSPHAIACANGTAALHIALICLGVKPGDQVLLPSLTFIASSNAVRYTHATPIFLDVSPETWTLDPQAIRTYLETHCHTTNSQTIHTQSNQPVTAIMPVHILGHPCLMDEINQIAHEFNLKVLEDATESLGAYYKAKPTGTLAHMAAFSFNGNKLITTGGGGMITTNNPDLAHRAKHLTTTAKIEPVEFIHDEVGYNYRLVNVLAALGVAQLEQLPQFLQTKKQIAERYDQAFQNIPQIQPMPHHPDITHANWLYTIQLANQSWRELHNYLDDQNIQTRPLWQPMHLSPANADLNPHPCPVTEKLAQECLSIPCSSGLTSTEQSRVIQAITTFFHTN